MRTEWTPEQVAGTEDDLAEAMASKAREAERERQAAYYMSRRREYNPNSDKPVCQGGPRWYR